MQAKHDETSTTAAVRLRRRPPRRYRYVRLRWRILFAVIDCVGTLIFGMGRRAGRWVKRLTRSGATAGLPSSALMKGALAEGDLTKGDSPIFAAQKSGQSPGADPRTILIIQLDHMGDAVLSTGMISVLRRRWPRASIEVLVGRWNRDLLAATDTVDRLHVSRLNRFSRVGRFGWPLAVFWWGWRLRRRRVDLGIDVRGEFPLALILWLCGARRRLGWAAGGGGFLLTDSPEFVPDRPETQSRGALLAELGIPVESARQFWPVFRPTEAARRSVQERLAQQGLQNRFIAVHISSGTTAKQWPTEHWRALVGRLIVEHGLAVVLVGSRQDRTIARSILTRKVWPGVYDWTGRCNMVELAALLERAEVVVGADSGPVHLATAVGRPVVVLFSGTNRPEQWQPHGRDVTVLRHPVPCSPCHRERCPRDGHPCMGELRPERVARAVLETLKAVGRRAVQEANLGRDSLEKERSSSGNCVCHPGAPGKQCGMMIERALLARGQAAAHTEFPDSL